MAKCKTMERPQCFSMCRVPRLEATSELTQPVEQSSRTGALVTTIYKDQHNLDRGATSLNLPLGEIGLLCLRVRI